MAGETLVKVLQIAGAALGIPAAAAGTFAAYQNYFSTDVTCQKLRSNIVATMERNVAPETKRSLLRKDVNEFDKLCGDGDPDARTIFHAAVAAEHPAAEAAETGHAAVAQPDASSRRSQLQSVSVFGAPGARLGCAEPPAVRLLGTPFQRIHDLRHVVAAAGHGLECANHAAGLVGAAGGEQRSDQAAEQASARRLRARCLDPRRIRSAVGRSRSGLMLIGMGTCVAGGPDPRDP
jgi:hypothetical protein